MNLVTLNIDTIQLNQPLPFVLRGVNGVLLAQKGYVIGSRSELETFGKKTLPQQIARLLQRADVFAARMAPRAARTPMPVTAAMQSCYYDEKQQVDGAGAAIVKTRYLSARRFCATGQPGSGHGAQARCHCHHAARGRAAQPQ